MTAEHSDEAVLRAKYLDWCSARIADVFLELTPEEIYGLAQEAEGGEPAAGEADSGAGAASEFRQRVETLTELLKERLRLPGFEAWAREYAADPARYDAELVGFWRTELRRGGDTTAEP